MFESLSPAHGIYIPAIALLGLVVGYLLGLRASRKQLERDRARLKE